ncbi:hypothetical protein AMTRI_Chr06g171710 [Amborella trichopoda]
MDFIDGLPNSKGSSTILVVVDRLSKYAHFIANNPSLYSCNSQLKHWAKWLTWVEFCYNTNWHSTIKRTPFEVVYGYAPPTLLTYDLKEQIKEAQARMKHVYDSKHREREFLIGDMNLKLSPKYYGPFKILQRIGAVAYKLDLPPNSGIHSVFHVSLLKKQIGMNTIVQTQIPSIREGDEALITKPLAILDCRTRKKQQELLIHWQGLSPSEATWDDLSFMKQQFPELALEDKGEF